MQPPLERDLRDALVRNLELIERGLRPVQFQEYPLPNAHGTRGSIDILALDRNDLWVVIELKRSKATSRQALHEVAKYTELLCREKHLAADRIRAMIIATPPDWDELLVPVSNVARDWSHDLRGYQLHLDGSGSPSHAERVKLLPQAFEHRITPIHVMFFFPTAEQRRQTWREITKLADEIGAADLLAADFDRIARKDLALAPFGLYLAIGRIDKVRASEHLFTGYDGPEPFASQYPAEYLALRGICNHVARQSLPGMSLESAQPGRLRDIANSPEWAVRQYRGTGAFSDTSPFGERDLYRFLSGDDRGDSQVIFTGSASPQITARWNGFLKETENSLAGNHEWKSLVHGWLNDAARRVGDGDVWLHVYSPCDLLQAIVFGWPDGLNEYLPMLIGGTYPEPGRQSLVRGTLCWNGGGTTLPEAVRLIHRDPIHWMVNRSAGLGGAYDQELLDLLGLHYVLLEKIGSDPTKGSPVDEHRIWRLREGTAYACSSHEHPQEYAEAYAEITANGEIVSIAKYLAQRRHQVDALAAEYRAVIDIR
ncbi:endonuclease NucS domain-containing protein [Marinactinospora thermotolerans]|uniref:endonuclease NucS domain-containing protein n=1 Tax=Marinactinospora thermotolerans TaxID=531310 RepID=UPI003D949203